MPDYAAPDLDSNSLRSLALSSLHSSDTSPEPLKTWYLNKASILAALAQSAAQVECARNINATVIDVTPQQEKA